MKYHIINLKERYDRRIQIQNHLKKFSIDFEFFEAIKPVIAEILESSIINPLKLWNFRSFSNEEDRKYCIGVSGCKFSHYKILQKLKDSEDNYSVILEDDCVLIDDYQIHLNKTLKYIEDNNIDFNILYLGCNLHSRNCIKVVDDVLLKCNLDKCFTTHSYLVKNSNIPRILEHIEKSDNEIDNTYTKLDKRFITNPLLTYQRNSVSDIISNNKMPIFYGYIQENFNFPCNRS